MTRRLALTAAIAAAPARSETPAPTDDARLNAFAARYNDYVEKLKRGQLDLAQWKLVKTAWNKLA